MEGEQLRFSLALPERELYKLERFFEGESNRIPASAAGMFGSEDSIGSLVITGPAGSGKSHLLKGISLKPGKQRKVYASAVELAGLSETALKKSMGFLASHDVVCVDDVDSVYENSLPFFNEMFNLFNRFAEREAYLAVAMRRSPATVSFLPDYLSSRLLSGMVVKIKKPGDEEKMEIIRKLAADRQISLTPRGAGFILERAGRSIGELVRLVEEIDAAVSPHAGSVGLQLIKRVIDLSRR